MRIDRCSSIGDFRIDLGRRRLPGPIFLDGALEGEVTYRRNTEALEQCDMVPNVLAGVENIDMAQQESGSNRMNSTALPLEAVYPPDHRSSLSATLELEKYHSEFTS